MPRSVGVAPRRRAARPVPSAARAMEEDAVTVEHISIEPNNCPLVEELKLEMHFTCHKALADAYWQVRYIADQTGKRKIVELGATEKQSYDVGNHSMMFHVPQVSVEHLSRHLLTNVGLLLAILYSGEAEVLQVSMVTQVTPADDGTLIRSVYNPLE